MAVLDSMMDPIEERPDHYRVFYNILDGDWYGRAPNHPQFNPKGRSCLQIIAKSNNKVISNIDLTMCEQFVFKCIHM